MKLSQLLKLMSKEDRIIVWDDSKVSMYGWVYRGKVSGLVRGNPINKAKIITLYPKNERTILVFCDMTNVNKELNNDSH